MREVLRSMVPISSNSHCLARSQGKRISLVRSFRFRKEDLALKLYVDLLVEMHSTIFLM